MTENANALDALKQKLRRACITFEIGGFKPSEDSAESWFGRVNLCAPGETWPMQDAKPMYALCQINLTALPFRPPRLDDFDFLTVFVAADDFPIDMPNGNGWCLRTYKSIDGLVSLAQPETGSPIHALPMRAQVVDEDYPCHEDLPLELPEQFEDHYYDYFNSVDGLKLGGWPRLIQSELFWGPFAEHPATPEYVFQIDSVEKANWFWGDVGVGYFGRGTAPGREDEWALTWQCY